MDARKQRYGESDALDLLTGITKLVVAKGKKVVRVDLKKDRPDDQTLVSLMLGPTGNLRAPTMRIGKTLLVGYHQEVFDEMFA